ncbi:hypothetical protein [Macrococcus capreoli]|uniref:hypothetical protein n=1 Tax=Macrococcus capreoli TaxID=2982690 RepID=UPI0021D60C15|nr:hypothetical protein [Macrococcus sp. TMW 2.2395]MCU7556550.1 hypothetical protein [Macrococcus sp. TMW 2.2395]
MKKFAGSRIELQLIKSEYNRVLKGMDYCFLYEVSRFEDTKQLINSLHNRIALRRVNKVVEYK